MGSSPLTRGKRLGLTRAWMRRGLIPAHAGKTGVVGVGWCGMGAHPRSRGENPHGSIRSIHHMGSSPLTRGKRPPGGGGSGEGGLIPAHAGKTHLVDAGLLQAGAHPRSRGENRSIRRPRAGRMGSSPLTRGKPRLVRLAPRGPGLIPAHAGKTL